MLPEIQIFKTETPKAKPADESTLGFGKTFSDHMFMIEYDEGQGWHDARIVPYGPISLQPAAPVLHYAQEIFEGLKAYRRTDGNGIQLFRPEENAKRMNNSAERMCMPTLDVAYQVAAMKALVKLEEDWVPHHPGTSLYLRPTMIATGNELGVHPSKHYLYYIICAPSGAYYKNGMAPVRIRISGYAVNGTDDKVVSISYIVDNEPKTANGDTGLITLDVENQTGTSLPSTGGMGTTLLYLAGGILVLAAVVLLVTKKRMASE